MVLISIKKAELHYSEIRLCLSQTGKQKRIERTTQQKILFLSRISVSSLRRGHANLLCIYHKFIWCLTNQNQKKKSEFSARPAVRARRQEALSAFPAARHATSCRWLFVQRNYCSDRRARTRGSIGFAT